MEHMPELVGFAAQAMDQLCRQMPKEKLELSMLNGGTFSYGTVFSGMGTPEYAMGLLKTETRARGWSFDPQLVVMCDKLSLSREYLKEIHGTKPCIMKDVRDFLKYRAGQRCGSMASTLKKPILKKVPCWQHGKHCVFKVPKLLVMGTPCTDFSNAGNQMGMLGPTMPPTFEALRLFQEAEIGLHENVRQFPALIEDSLSTKKVYKIPAEPADIGYGKIVQRKRVYRVLANKSIQMIYNPAKLYKSIAASFRNNAKLEDCMIADQKEIDEHAKGQSFKDGLTLAQRKHRRRYSKVRKSMGRKRRNLVYHLNDNPYKRRCWSSTVTGAAPTFRAAMGPLWHAKKQRPLMPSEMRRMMGWAGKGPKRPLGSIRKLLGNSMHVGNVYLALLCLMACTPARAAEQMAAFGGA